ncbi:MAG: hypothetical protein ACK2U3_13860 [Anaerolineales bacterium]|jgi:hypothetical protein
MDRKGFTNYLSGRNTPEDKIGIYLVVAEQFESKRALSSSWIEPAEISAFSQELIKRSENSWDNYIGLVRYTQFTENWDAFEKVIELLDGSEVMDNLHRKTGDILGENNRARIFDGIQLPELGTRPEEKPALTGIVMQRLELVANKEQCREILSDCLRDLPDEDYMEERRKYLDCASLEEYLELRKMEFTAELEKIRDQGGLFYTQKVTDEVIEFVRSSPEIGGGVRKGDIVYQTKIPYKTAEWLVESDENLKKYYYCHCPWVREAFRAGKINIPSTFCNCSAGFMKKPFEVMFGRKLKAEMVQTVLGGDPWCRAAIYLPEGA